MRGMHGEATLRRKPRFLRDLPNSPPRRLVGGEIAHDDDGSIRRAATRPRQLASGESANAMLDSNACRGTTSPSKAARPASRARSATPNRAVREELAIAVSISVGQLFRGHVSRAKHDVCRV